ncbi:FAD-binding oxidoreductase [archaeon]|nr:MAG: FAD-binding oxidoreductase [archaeon]
MPFSANRLLKFVGLVRPCLWSSSRCYSRALDFKQDFEHLLGPDNVLSQPSDIEHFTTDWLKSYKGGSLVCFPKSTHDITEVMKFCHQRDIPVVCQGGNTGLVGGSVGTSLGELILSMSKMNKVISVDPVAGTVTCEAGCVLETLNTHVSSYGYTIPLDLGAKGSCMIGGNLATNAGGLRVIKFGSLHNAILGMEVVMANGQKLDMLRNIHKDNCGYPLKHIFIGSEGTLGIITKVCIKLAIKPKYTSVLLLKVHTALEFIITMRLQVCTMHSGFYILYVLQVDEFAKVGSLLVEAKQSLGDTLSAFEFIEGGCFDLYAQHNRDIYSSVDSDVVPSNKQLAVLVEVSGSSLELDKMRCENFVEHVFKLGLVSGGVMAADSKQERTLWKVREQVPVELLRVSRMIFPVPTTGGMQLHSKLFKFDLSLPLMQVPSFVENIKQGFRQRGHEVVSGADERDSWIRKLIHQAATTGPLPICMQVFNFGHAGDQNIHLNIIASFPMNTDDKEWVYEKQIVVDQLQEVMEEVIYLPILRLRGMHVLYTVYMFGYSYRQFFYGCFLFSLGSLSAEHGVGVQKKKAMLLSKSSEEVEVMRGMKALLDPQNILNPGKVL